MVKKVITRICGGIGNQMFSYAVGEKLARKYNVKQEFDLIEYFSSKYLFRKGISTRTFQLRCFKGPCRYHNWPLWKSLFLFALSALDLAIKHDFFRKALSFLGMHLHRSTNLFFPDADDNPREKSIIYSTWLMLSTDKMPPVDVLRQEFALTNPLAPKNAKLLSDILSSNSISLHVRRTDYLIQQTPWNLDDAYYAKAMTIMEKAVPNPKWFVFSDDPAWCQQNFSHLSNVIFVQGNDACPWEDLELMKSCQHHIIANSTFSWWGAYLSSNRGTTIYPKRWGPYVREELPPTFIPNHWIGID